MSFKRMRTMPVKSSSRLYPQQRFDINPASPKKIAVGPHINDEKLEDLFKQPYSNSYKQFERLRMPEFSTESVEIGASSSSHLLSSDEICPMSGRDSSAAEYKSILSYLTS